jgi:hypothetical protein
MQDSSGQQSSDLLPVCTSQNLDTQCFGPKHATFALALGVPVLLLLVAFPALQAMLLARRARREPEGLYKPVFWTHYGFLFSDYRHRVYLWGCLREVRQLLLVTLVVVLQAQPQAQVQLLAGWILALLLLGLHAALAPFKTKLLNALQLAMLASLAFTFYVGVLSTVEVVPGVAASVLQHIAVIVDALAAVALLGALLWRARLVFDNDRDGKVSWNNVKQTCAQHSGAAAAALGAAAGWVSSMAGACSCGARNGHARQSKG